MQQLVDRMVLRRDGAPVGDDLDGLRQSGDVLGEDLDRREHGREAQRGVGRDVDAEVEIVRRYQQ